MIRRLHVHDPRGFWQGRLAETCSNRGWSMSLVKASNPLDGGYGFIRPHSHPDRLRQDREIAAQMSARLTMVQDAAQIATYDDKRAQIARWSRWMPETWVFEQKAEAQAFVEDANYPLVSKADVGASSVNVRLLQDKAAAVEHIDVLFGSGIVVDHGSSPHPHLSVQRDYVILQPFIPHEITYRVNIVGNDRAAFFRRCHARENHPFAQTGNVEPAYGMTADLEPLIAFADAVADDIETRWCALDILKDGEQFRLLETSLAWPWPSPGDCNNGRFLRGGRKWIELMDVLLDEIEAGTWH